MIKKYIGLFSFLVFFIAVSGCAVKNNPENIPADTTAAPEDNQDNTDIIFFYGQECPHCQNVEKYFTENKTAGKIQFSQKEVYHNKDNKILMAEKAKACGIADSELGVPMLWTKDNKCLFGDKDIIDFFNQKMNGVK